MTKLPRLSLLCLVLLLGSQSGCGGSTGPADSAGNAGGGGDAGDGGDAGNGGDAANSCTYEGETYTLGDRFPSSDGCNTCSCSESGVACTERACAPGTACGARAGATCSESEYCAYEPGAYCGAADAQAVCKPRPEACDDLLAPVCGCDGTTYPNACSANAAGQGVNETGDCPAN